MKHRSLLYLILLPFGLTINFFSGLAILNFIGLASVLLAILTKKKLFVLLSLGIIFCQVVAFATSQGSLIRQELARDPGGAYTTDMRAFLKTYYLMKAGENFYDAFPAGMSGLIGKEWKTDLAGWREPLPYAAWTVLPGDGESIYYLGVVLVVLSLLAGFIIAKKFLSSERSLMIPYLLLPYFFLPLSNLTIVQAEWWGLGLLLVGLAFYVHNRLFISGIFFALALANREIFLIPILSILAVTLLFKKAKNLFPIVTPLIIFAVYFFFFHLPEIIQRQIVLLRPTHLADWRLLNVTFAYSSWNYLLGVWRPFLILFVVTTSLLVFLLTKKHWRPALLLLALYLPTFVFTLMDALIGGLTIYHDYWGIYFVPLLIIASPIALATFLPTSSHE